MNTQLSVKANSSDHPAPATASSFKPLHFLCLKLKESGSIMALALDLQDFLLRARVLKLYRQALRITRRAPVDARGSVCSFEILTEKQLMFTGELRSTIRQELENNRHCNDRQRIRFFLSEGLERLKRLDEMLDMQGHPE
ncbi:LYR family of Fe/S cluster biogenesis protein [Prunus dulcis]|uniref:LYR motif-containing protein 2 n=1 Tax=Prunus dulcis TaxID=3755 RepID=A0A4Y1QSD3_PRUDU|nr:LYR family of Fe/S cluster biogenesis protein [Prunus dulcis]